ncbi:MAG: hydroxyphenylacetyl-CoA thioesterase PaaI [Gammaproteobacteria bacterium]|nr:hydroxyphenylacetyl-CoA thioesterase PaaI [Gammaproteobacteria bacterium]MDH4314245.1 hydroxyphenylacetyl-CoA thioesterase PaaI [Gammaproteobacteria bacterium]MDH5213630.1 hydroxyphenylacetyl-CoA thioesterase PaaI [Gammaproteobacteria bacterium]
MSELERARRCADRMYDNDRASRDLGIRVTVTAPGSVTAEMTVVKAMLNGFDVCHGGYIFTLADTAFAFACNAYDDLTVAAGASIEFLRPAVEGDQLTAVASEQSRSRRNGIYDVQVRNQHGKPVALFRGRAHATGEPLSERKSDT